MEQFDKMLKEMAEQEELMVPNGFDERLQKTLDNLPSKAKSRGLGAVKGALIAAAVCAALLCTAFAASPGLRGMLAETLGGFAPYAQEQAGEPYVINGIEFRVKSVLADDFTVRAYVETRDLEGDRLSADINVYGSVNIPRESDGIQAFVFSGTCLSYDKESKTALLSVTSWGQSAADDLSGSTVVVWSLTDKQTMAELLDDGLIVPVEVTPIDSKVLNNVTELTVSSIQIGEIHLSALGISALFNQDDAWARYAGRNASAKLKDGTIIEAPWEGGQGDFGCGTESARKVLVWNFREPVEAEDIEGIYVGDWYFPVK